MRSSRPFANHGVTLALRAGGDRGRLCLHHAQVTVLAGSERIEVRGRAALVIGLITRHAAWFNATPVGRLVVSFAHGKTTVDLTQSIEALRHDVG